MKETGKCCLCGGDYDHWGNNPDPLSNLKGDRCCDKCNSDLVIPTRLIMMAPMTEKARHHLIEFMKETKR